MKVVAPVRCPHCRSRLTSKYLSYFGGWTRWCKRCLCTVSYDDRYDHWFFINPIVEDSHVSA